jgi:hypothetical protein
MLREMDSLKDKTNLQQVNFEIIKLQVKKEAVENEFKHWTMIMTKEKLSIIFIFKRLLLFLLLFFVL